jgi:hypothetical protein
MWAVPAVVGGVQATAALRGARADAGALEGQASTALRQSNRDEEAQRRRGRQQLGTMAATMAQSGGGVDENVLRQSAVNAELDALNIRYGGQMRARGLLAEAKSLRKNSKFLAAAALLSGGSASYSAYKAR